MPKKRQRNSREVDGRRPGNVIERLRLTQRHDLAGMTMDAARRSATRIRAIEPLEKRTIVIERCRAARDAHIIDRHKMVMAIESTAVCGTL